MENSEYGLHVRCCRELFSIFFGVVIALWLWEKVFIPKRFMLMFYRVKRHDAYNSLLIGSYNFYIKMKQM